MPRSVAHCFTNHFTHMCSHQLEVVYTVGDSADVKCPGEAPDVFAYQALKKGESDLVAYNVYYPLGGALGALCK
jgi:hypothetical protein